MSARMIAGNVVAICTVWLWWASLAPVIAGGFKPAAQVHMHICPYISVMHGVGSDLKTWAKERDLCGT
jgi:hypothetical protein